LTPRTAPGTLGNHTTRGEAMLELGKKALETIGFGVRYPGGVVGLREVSAGFAANRVTAIIGPSGCGKSTFLRGINRLTDEFGCEYEGRVILSNGADVLKLNAYDLCLLRGEKVGYVTQKPTPFSGKTVLQDVAMPLKALGVRGRDVVYARARAALEKAALWDETRDRLHHLSTSLSIGQQQRLCIARAIINAPEILLLDEPCSSLDPRSTQLIESLIVDLARDHTVLLVTHNMQQAQRVAEYTMFLYEGTLVEYGPTPVLFSNPSHHLTADYIIGKFS